MILKVCKESEVLTKEEKAKTGGVINKEWKVYTTNKSGKNYLDTKYNFLECIKRKKNFKDKDCCS